MMKLSLLLVAALNVLLAAFLHGNAVESVETSVPKRLLAEIGDAPDFAIIWNTKGDADFVAEKLTKYLQILAETNPELGVPPVDLRPVVQALGFSSVQGIAASSTDLGGIHEVRTFLYAPDGLTGFLAVAGNKNFEFQLPDFAPAGSSIAMELGLDLGALRNAARQSLVSIMGETGSAMLDGQLEQPVHGTEITWNALLDILSTHYIGYGNLDIAEDGQPLIEFVIKADGAGQLLTLLAGSIEGEQDMSLAETERGLLLTTTAIPEASLAPVALAHKEDGALYIGSRLELLDAHFSGTNSKLKDDPQFQKRASTLPTTGTAISYISPDYFQFYLKAMKSVPQDQTVPIVEALMRDYFSRFDEPQISVSTMIADGMRSIGYSDQSVEEALFVLPVALIAATAVPAYENVRQASKEKAIVNNLQMIAGAAESYFAETGEITVNVADLIGPESYIVELNPVAGERYEHLVVTPESLLSVSTADGRTIFFDMSTWDYWTAPAGSYDPFPEEWEEHLHEEEE